MNVRQLKQIVTKTYQDQNGERFFSEKALLSALLEKNGMDRNLVLLQPDLVLSEKCVQTVLSDLDELLSGYPLQYYLGSEYFCGNEFFVRDGVLIPRPETELLVSLGKARVGWGSTVFDLCCGSGCVGISLLLARPDLSCHAFDLSDSALEVARINRARFGLEDRLSVKHVDVLSSDLEEEIKRRNPALILANPPYLTEQEMKEIAENVAKEPGLALFGGKDGLLFYRRFVELCAKTGVPFLCEMGYQQKEKIETIILDAGLKGEFFQDEARLWRSFFVSV